VESGAGQAGEGTGSGLATGQGDLQSLPPLPWSLVPCLAESSCVTAPFGLQGCWEAGSPGWPEDFSWPTDRKADSAGNLLDL
jgi:hypothetical protein